MPEEKYNADELVAQSWMDNIFFEKLLNKLEDSNVKLTNVEIRPGSKMGDHYASVMYRAILNYEKGAEKITKILIVKTMPEENCEKKEFLSGMDLFKTEIKMYAEIIPAIEKTLRTAGDNTVIGGKCVYSSTEPHEIMIFEDLTELGYKTISVPLMDVGLHAIEKLGKWHAATYKLNADGYTELHKFNRNYFGDEKCQETPFMKECMDNFELTLKADKELEQYLPHFYKMKAKNPSKIMQDRISNFKETDARVIVLNHGDFHMKNVMYTDDSDGKIDDVKLLDFQLCNWGPAALDIIYLLYIMLDIDTRLNRREEMIYFYYQHFAATLEKLKFDGPIPELSDFYKDLNTFRHNEFIIMISFTPLGTLRKDNTEPVDLAEIMTSSELRRTLYTKSAFVSDMKKVMPQFLHRGLLQ